jgi:hypothetical protein
MAIMQPKAKRVQIPRFQPLSSRRFGMTAIQAPALNDKRFLFSKRCAETLFTNRGRSPMLDAHPVRLPRHAPSLLERFSEILSILSQALSAAHHYEELSRKCDAALAERGLKRADLPRAAFKELTKGTDHSGGVHP